MLYYSKSLLCHFQWRKFGNRPPPPPSVNRHSLSEILGSVGIFKTIDYSEIDRKNYWRVRQLIRTERRSDYLEIICLICCVNHISHFCAGSYLLKEPKTMKNPNKFVGNSRSFAPPLPELNFRHWPLHCFIYLPSSRQYMQTKRLTKPCTVKIRQKFLPRNKRTLCNNRLLIRA